MFDWSLNEPLIGFSFQDASSTEPFYVKCVALHSNFPSIIQLEHIENQYFVVNSLENLMYIFDQEGKTIKKIQIEADNTVIKLNSKNHLVWCIVFEKSLKLYNKYGELQKEIVLTKSKKGYQSIEDFFIDSNDELKFLCS